jgi:hypothetical protein
MISVKWKTILILLDLPRNVPLRVFIDSLSTRKFLEAEYLFLHHLSLID